MRRWISLVVAIAMFVPAAASAAEGAMATWLSPQPGQIVSGGKIEVAIGYNTQSKLKVSSIELYIDGQFLSRKVLRAPESRGVCSFWWDTTRVEQGTHNLVVKVFAGDQMISKIYGTATVGPNGSSRGLIDTRPPVVTFANIKSGDVLKGSATIKMNAADDSGESPMVSLLVDDVLKLLKNTPPYTYDLDTKTYPDGDHSLKTYAYDGAGNRSDPAVVKVAFVNGVDRPVVTTLSVSPEPVAEVPDENVSQAVPPAVSGATEPSIKKTAARAESRISSESSTVAPVVASPQPKPKPQVVVTAPTPKPEPKVVVAAPRPEPKMVAIAPKPVVSPKPALAAPKLESKLRAVPVTAKQEMRSSSVAPKLDARMAAAAPKVSETRIAAPVAKRAAPVLASKPVRMASAVPSVNVREGIVKPTMSATAVGAKPIVIESPRTSGVRIVGGALLPNAKQAPASAPSVVSAAKSAAPKIAEPKRAAAAVAPKQALSAPKPSGVTRMAMAPAPVSLRQAAQKIAPGAAVATAPRVVDDPVSSSVKNMAIKLRVGDLKDSRIAPGTMSVGTAAAPTILAPGTLSKANPKRAVVAMVPDLRSADERFRPSPAIARPPSVEKPTTARIEKTVMPAKGKVKARSFFEKMGGVLFWDPSTHLVTACVGGMALEMRIGSKTARVNGHKMTMESAPYLANNRTIFEVRSYAQACALLDRLSTVGEAAIH